MFAKGNHIVYPAHGVGLFVCSEFTEVAGQMVEFYVVEFPRDKMKLKISASKAKSVGLRLPSSPEIISKALELLSKSVVRPKKIIWNRRAQEYETKINTGEPCIIAEVIRELAFTEQGSRSYSEKMVYQLAVERLAREMAIVESIDVDKAIARIEHALRRPLKLQPDAQLSPI